MRALLFILAIAAFAQSRQTRLSLTVRPEAAVTALSGDEVEVKVRLAEGATAALWRAETCEAPPQQAARVNKSGTQRLTLPGEGRLVCLQSSDGALRYQADAYRAR